MDREFEIQTPIGTVRSDSGNHAVDVLSVTAIIIFMFIVSKLWSKL
jgi:hypothetical protein